MNRSLQGAWRTLVQTLSVPHRVSSSRRAGVNGSLGIRAASVGLTTLLAVMAIATILTTLELPRNALWMVVRVCVAINQGFAIPFPCLVVKTGPQGFTVLRAPGSRTHLIVTPIVPMSGLESLALQLSPPYWQAALDARVWVLEGASAGRRQVGDIALAINSRRSRSQDHLHIHADCAAPQILRNIRAGAAAIGPNWAPLPYPIEDAIYWARRVPIKSKAAENAFLSLRELPNNMHPENVTLGTVNLSADGTGDFVQLVSDEAASRAEDLLAISCMPGVVD